jgi:hypothetical protein
MKDKTRPTAKEWYTHLDYLCKNIKQCKKNPDHAYFTNKGCGLCAIEGRIQARLSQIKKEKTEPQTLRGIKIDELTTEKNAIFKKAKKRENKRLKRLSVLFIILNILIWSGVPILLYRIKGILTTNGIFLQILIWVLLLKVIFISFDKIGSFLPLLKNTLIVNMLKIYALIIAALAFCVTNELTLNSFSIFQ